MPTMPKAINYNVQRPEAPARAADPDTPFADLPVAEQLRRIEAEELSGKQLRLARRNAAKHQLAVASDIDAVRLMRLRGLDPFEPSKVMDLVVSNRDPVPVEAPPKGTLPMRAETARMVSTEVADETARIREIRRMQRDIARRRSLRMSLLAVRLAIFILLPAAIAGYYFYRIATPLYASDTAFVIESTGSSGGGSSGGGLAAMMGSGGMGGGGNDAVNVQTYLESRSAMFRLNEEKGFAAAFAGPEIDPLLRLPDDASDEDAYKLYQRLVKIGYDPTEGIVKMEVSAINPETAAEYAAALLSYAEDMVDGLSQRVRDDQMRGAREGYEEAETKVQAAQDKVLELEKLHGVVSAEAELSARMGRIAALESQLAEKQLALQAMLDNAEPNAARVGALRGDIRRLETMIDAARGDLTEAENGETSIAEINAELVFAQSELMLRQQMRAEALLQLQAAQKEANRQVRYLLVVKPPVATDEPAYPRAFENTILVLLVFAAIYLMISLTASILREQVAS